MLSSQKYYISKPEELLSKKKDGDKIVFIEVKMSEKAQQMIANSPSIKILSAKDTK